jgi:acetylornithine deacetylase/succinyl-diaminopimelate desuccinylase-like protein
MLGGGHAVNALPQTARAVVNCRMMPSEKVDDVKATLVRVLGDDHISVTLLASCSAALEFSALADHWQRASLEARIVDFRSIRAMFG